MSDKSFWYLATPYSKYPFGLEDAFFGACHNAAVLIRAGIPVFSPIAHTHPIAMRAGIDPYDHSIWLPADAPMIAAAQGLIVCKMPSWDISFGIKHEIDTFHLADKPVVYMTPGLVPHELLNKAEI